MKFDSITPKVEISKITLLLFNLFLFYHPKMIGKEGGFEEIALQTKEKKKVKKEPITQCDWIQDGICTHSIVCRLIT